MADPVIVRAATLTFLVNNPDVERPELAALLERTAPHRERPDGAEENDSLVYVQDSDDFIAAFYNDGSEDGYKGAYQTAFEQFLADGGTLEQ